MKGSDITGKNQWGFSPEDKILLAFFSAAAR